MYSHLTEKSNTVYNPSECSRTLTSSHSTLTPSHFPIFGSRETSSLPSSVPIPVIPCVSPRLLTRETKGPDVTHHLSGSFGHKPLPRKS